MMRRDLLKWFGAAAAVAASGGIAGTARAAEVLKIGTLAPSNSPWGQVFKAWADAVKNKTGGNVELQFSFNGAQGDEAAMVGKMKAGTLDGAAVTAVGLSKIYKPILALQIPGLFTSWSKLDAARDGMKGEFEKGASDAGFQILGWGDVGMKHVMSRGFAVRTPDGIKGQKPYVWRDDPVQPLLFQVIGGVTPVPLSTAEVLPSLNSGAVDVTIAPALVAEQLQWSGKLDTIVTDLAGVAIGGLVISGARLASLSEADRAVIVSTGKAAAESLKKKIRDADAAAFGRLKSTMTVVELSADERSKWATVYKQLRDRLKQGTFDPGLVSKLEGFAA